MPISLSKLRLSRIWTVVALSRLAVPLRPTGCEMPMRDSDFAQPWRDPTPITFRLAEQDACSASEGGCRAIWDEFRKWVLSRE